jgi:hypothetical protein
MMGTIIVKTVLKDIWIAIIRSMIRKIALIGVWIPVIGERVIRFMSCTGMLLSHVPNVMKFLRLVTTVTTTAHT